MLHAITWNLFIRFILITTSLYYVVILLLYYRSEILKIIKGRKLFLLLTATAILAEHTANAQADGNNGLSQANTMVRGYFETATQLMYAIGALVGLIGAVRVFSRRHKEDMGGEIAIWVASCIFLVVVATVLKSFFGL